MYATHLIRPTAEATPARLAEAQAVIDQHHGPASGIAQLTITGLTTERPGPSYYGSETFIGTSHNYTVWSAEEGQDLGNGERPAEPQELPLLVEIYGMGLFTAEAAK